MHPPCLETPELVDPVHPNAQPDSSDPVANDGVVVPGRINPDCVLAVGLVGPADVPAGPGYLLAPEVGRWVG